MKKLLAWGLVWLSVAAFRLERNKNGQPVRIAPIKARGLKFVITSNRSNATRTELAAFANYDDGSRPAGVAEVMKKDDKVDVYGICLDFASAALHPESRQTLDEILSFHKADPAQKLVIEGHTDSFGSDKTNRELAIRQAKAVVAELVRMGTAGKNFCISTKEKISWISNSFVQPSSI